MQTHSATLLLVAVDPIAGSVVLEAARQAFAPVRLVALSTLQQALKREEVARDENPLIREHAEWAVSEIRARG